MAILLQVIHGDTYMDDNENDEESTKMPLLVYVSRERRPSKPHRFKAGALNALVSYGCFVLLALYNT